MKRLSAAKAKKILKHGSVRGHDLTPAQRGFMGIVASGKTPRKAKRGKKR